MHPRPLPTPIEDLIVKTQSPPRLRAHLCLVHDIACQLTEQISGTWPKLVFDTQAVRLGAATHDIGKAIYRRELSEPGHAHEHAGLTLLLAHGWSQESARFTVSHGKDLDAKDPLEDLLVAVADKVWKGTREESVEQALVGRVATMSGEEPWQVWLNLDDILTALAEPASERIRWQESHPV